MTDRKTFAIAYALRPKEVALWCRDEGTRKDGSRAFYVLNGDWRGRIAPDGLIHIQGDRDDGGFPALVVWEGIVPEPNDRDYNSAIVWIQEQIA